MASSTSDPKSAIRARARAEGFEAVRFTRAELPERARNDLVAFLAEGRHGTMAWMEDHAARRGDPKTLWPEAQSVILLGVNYGPVQYPLDILTRRERGAISAYAQGSDYHDVIKKKLKRLARFVAENFGGDVKVFVDTAPVMEKPLAAAAGIGWQGKHTNLVSRDFGSWLFLGSVFTTLKLEPDEAEPDHCGECVRCLDACPTGAIAQPYRMDARRCISYLTIEHKDHIAREFREAIGNRIYGCDDCLAVCPWNKFAQVAAEAKFHARAELAAPLLADLAKLDDGGFRELFRASPVKRIGRDRFVRNVLIAIGNSADAALTEDATRLLNDASPLVRAMAVWALSKLAKPAMFAAQAKTHLPNETDAAVRAEWKTASAPR